VHVITASGYKLPNRFARTTLEVVEQLLTPDGLESLLTKVNLQHLIDAYPSANLERGFDFADMAALNTGFEQHYGARGGRSLALRVGRKVFDRTSSRFGELSGLEAAAFRLMPANLKMRVGLSLLVRIFSHLSDQKTTLAENRHEFQILVHRNPYCWGRAGEEKPVCFFFIGLLDGATKYISGGKTFRIDESECVAADSTLCRFVIQKTPMS
jgi:predicted hydrocarbon binding protein